MPEFQRTDKNKKIYDSINVASEANISTSKDTDSYEPKRIRKETDDVEVIKDKTVDLINSFIEEVKRYNIKSGLRTVEDTNINILNELGFYKKEETNIVTTDVVSNEVEEVIELEPISNIDEHEIEKQKEISKELHDLIYETSNIPIIDSIPVDEEIVEKLEVTNDTLNIDEITSKLLEETQSLKIKITKQEEEIVKLSKGVVTSNKFLSIFIIVTIICLLAMVGVMIYWLLINRGSVL